MIISHDRTGYIGASDTSFVMGNWKTKTFEKWFAEKLGFSQPKWNNKYTLAGTYYEHAIIDSLGVMEKDRQIILEDLRLRINLDGNTDTNIYEIKTHKKPWNKIPKNYIQQVNVQMYASSLNGNIVAYQMKEEDYNNFFNPIDKNRLTLYPIEYDEKFIEKYLEKVKILSNCIKKGKFPNV